MLANQVPSAEVTRNVLAELPDGILTLNAAGIVSYANPLAHSFFPSPEPQGTPFRALLELSGVTNYRLLVDAVEAREPSAAFQLELADGRTLDSQSRPLAGGGSVVTFFDVTEYLKDAERKTRDALTGLPNRQQLRNRLSELFLQAMRTQSRFGVIAMDLDRFKAVNDTLGHQIGDALLVKVAERLRQAVRSGDIVARTGGDEFVIVQVDMLQPQSAAALGERIVDLVSRTYLLSGNTIDIGVSVGVAIAPIDGQDAETLLKHADLALYRAKNDGRATYRFYQNSMDKELEDRRQLELDLRTALALRQFEIAYQPQMGVDAKRLVGFEALLRWTSPSRGAVPPGDFIPLAEQVGLIVPIGDWVLRTACREVAGWAGPVSVAVNVSAPQFRDNKLARTINSALTQSGLDPARLEIEITEGVLLTETDTVLQQLRDIKALGVRVAMDDFGTGYSSLSYLLKFPFDKIKIDQSFVRGSLSNASSAAIIQAVSALGKSLGITTIAEGVETPEQLARVEREGCNEVQGFLTGRPLGSAAAALLTEKHSVAAAPEESR